MTDAQRQELVTEMLSHLVLKIEGINGQVCVSYNADMMRRVIAQALADAERRVWEKVEKECQARSYVAGMNEPLRINHLYQFLEWIRTHAGQEVQP